MLGTDPNHDPQSQPRLWSLHLKNEGVSWLPLRSLPNKFEFFKSTFFFMRFIQVLAEVCPMSGMN